MNRKVTVKYWRHYEEFTEEFKTLDDAISFVAEQEDEKNIWAEEIMLYVVNDRLDIIGLVRERKEREMKRKNQMGVK